MSKFVRCNAYWTIAFGSCIEFAATPTELTGFFPIPVPAMVCLYRCTGTVSDNSCHVHNPSIIIIISWQGRDFPRCHFCGIRTIRWVGFISLIIERPRMSRRVVYRWTKDEDNIGEEYPRDVIESEPHPEIMNHDETKPLLRKYYFFKYVYWLQ